MSIECRMVPANWEHPKDPKTGEYIPLNDETADNAFYEWIKDFECFKESELERIINENPNLGYSVDEPYKAYCDWAGTPPDPAFYREYSEDKCSWYQMYECQTEGTPFTPAFEKQEDLVKHLIDKEGFDREYAESYVLDAEDL